MNKRTKNDLKFLLILFVLLIAYILFKVIDIPVQNKVEDTNITELEMETKITASPNSTMPQITTDTPKLDYLKDCGTAPGSLFSVSSGSGYALLEGVLEITPTPHPYGEPGAVKNIFFVFSKDGEEGQHNFYSFYKSYTETHTKSFIKTINGNVYFQIGILENETISSTAEISDYSQKELARAAGQNEGLKLKITISDNEQLPLGLPVNFTPACHIEVIN
ncbi:MAG: hypothetical protein ABIH78_05010 [Candidatus Peregrinibacteria bacterium]